MLVRVGLEPLMRGLIHAEVLLPRYQAFLSAREGAGKGQEDFKGNIQASGVDEVDGTHL